MATLVDFKQQLLTDPSFAVSYIVQNNPVDVASRLRGLGFRVSNTSDVFEALNALITADNWNAFWQALSVPYKAEGIDAAEVAIVLEVAQGMANAAKFTGGQPARSAQGFGTSEPVYGPLTEEETNAQNESGNGGAGALDWVNAFSNLATGVIAIFTQNNGADQVRPVDTSTNGGGNGAATDAARKAQMQRNLMIGGGILLAIVVLVLVWMKLKKKG